MSIDLTKQQHGFLKRLFTAGGTSLQKDMRPKPKPAEHSSLVEAKLVTRVPHGRSFMFAVTDVGREWITDHPEYSAPPKPFPVAKQRLFLLQLAFMGGNAAGKDLKADLTPSERTALSAEKLLQEDRGPKRCLLFTLTDPGWKWAEDHLADPSNTASLDGPAAATLQQVLVRVSAYLSAGDLRLADVIRIRIAPKPAKTNEQSHVNHSESEIEKAIEAACLRLGGGHDRQRLRLADVRHDLTAWDRPAQDRALFELATEGRLVLYGMSDPQEIQADDREAEYKTPSGEVRHLVYWVDHRAEPVR